MFPEGEANFYKNCPYNALLLFYFFFSEFVILFCENTDRSIPAEKCFPVDEITITLANASWSIAVIISGNSSQKDLIILFIFSGLFSTNFAILFSILKSKQSNC